MVPNNKNSKHNLNRLKHLIKQLKSAETMNNVMAATNFAMIWRMHL
jgi:hypothetical protein